MRKSTRSLELTALDNVDWGEYVERFRYGGKVDDAQIRETQASMSDGVTEEDRATFEKIKIQDEYHFTCGRVSLILINFAILFAT